MKLRCIKDLAAGSVKLCKKGDVIEAREQEDCYYKPNIRVHCPYEYNEEPSIDRYAYKETKINYFAYHFNISWLHFSLYSSKDAAEHKNGKVVWDYFERIENIELTAENVESIHKECLRNGESDYIIVYGIQNSYVYCKSSIDHRKDDIKKLLMQLPENFMKSKGGGWSFLNMCMTKDNRQWTGLHTTIEKLVCLGLVAGLCEFLVPKKELWKIFPGEMPYIVIKD